MRQGSVGVPRHEIRQVVLLQGDGFHPSVRLAHVGYASGLGGGEQTTGCIGHAHRPFDGNQCTRDRLAFVEHRDAEARGTREGGAGLRRHSPVHGAVGQRDVAAGLNREVAVQHQAFNRALAEAAPLHFGGEGERAGGPADQTLTAGLKAWRRQVGVVAQQRTASLERYAVRRPEKKSRVHQRQTAVVGDLQITCKLMRLAIGARPEHDVLS